MDDRAAKGYDDKKLFKCVCCGKDVLLTKFASAKTARCQECKTNGSQPNANIISSVAQPSTKQKSQPIVGDKKQSQCTVCGAEVMIGKFASHKTALCDNCKGEPEDKADAPLRIDISKIDRSQLPSIEEMYVMPTVIGNHNLRNVECPACHRRTNIIKINDSSPIQGLVLTYQCDNPKCLALIMVSEQSRWRMKPMPSSTIFNYRGEQLRDLASAIVDTRARNAIEYLIGLCEEHDIQIDGARVPEHLRFIDIKEVPVGLNTKGVDINGKDGGDQGEIRRADEQGISGGDNKGTE